MPPFSRDRLERHMEEVERQEAITQKPMIVSESVTQDQMGFMFSLCQHGNGEFVVRRYYRSVSSAQL
ncbi:hypothetical protein PENANT_c010G00725 [Penicillium antarcticum]|uniref:Uncharacterized protein n=1 Tax=Penicillium antarcticum TaxID=416450 RepID=A0A1V6Q8C2_9EURO|nr:hypothetical protein PENANT_c010G00725 [Penicillium antarcticum]